MGQRTGTTALRRHAIIAACLAMSGAVGGCGALTRVDMATYQREYDSVYPLGMNYDDAVRKIEAAGYACEKPWHSPPITVQGEKVEVMIQDCSRRSLELMCPQRRHVTFDFRVSDRRVVEVRKPHLEDQSCF